MCRDAKRSGGEVGAFYSADIQQIWSTVSIHNLTLLLQHWRNFIFNVTVSLTKPSFTPAHPILQKSSTYVSCLVCKAICKTTRKLCIKYVRNHKKLMNYNTYSMLDAYMKYRQRNKRLEYNTLMLTLNLTGYDTTVHIPH
jgi:hypothetical protein